ncbi:hypothetical protein BVY03_01400 [bacterium K02(2017)]|nr:hypothetical protein BVY03_01400 [bacterium K02(2017)]
MQQIIGPYAQYKRQKDHAIESADRVTLITMLLEGALSYNKKVLAALDDYDKMSALEYTDYGVKIVLHLYSCLDFEQGGEIATRLGRLYNYVCDQYVVFQKCPDSEAPINNINKVLTLILDGWKKIPKSEEPVDPAPKVE